MARQVKPDEYAARRREILDAALDLLSDKGYERMTIEDVLVKTGMSKGALYHYFRSKYALLEGVVEAMGEGAMRELRAVVEDPKLDAIGKLHAYFRTEQAWKSGNVTTVSTVMRLPSEDNAQLRQKLSRESTRTAAPLLETIIRQGCDEGVFDTGHPHEAAVIITGMGHQLADAFIEAIEADGNVGADISGPHVRAVLAAYVEAFERILGAPSGSLTTNTAITTQIGAPDIRTASAGVPTNASLGDPPKPNSQVPSDATKQYATDSGRRRGRTGRSIGRGRGSSAAGR